MNTGLVWFRNDLRVHDNEILAIAAESNDQILGVYFFDPRQYQETSYGFPKTGKFRAKFLIETIQNLQKNLKQLNIPLLIVKEKPEDAVASIISEYQITDIYFQEEWTFEEKEVENALRKNAENVDFHSFYQQFLFHPDDIPFSNFQNIPRVFTDFRKKCEKNSEVRKLIPVPKKRDSGFLKNFESNIPSLQELGLDDFEVDRRSAFPFKGGEENAMNRVEDYFFKSKNLEEYKETRNGLIGTDYSSKLSAWLANGSISPRQIYAEVKKYEQEVTSNQSTYWLIFELIWRDFFKYVSLKHGTKIFMLEGIRQKDHEWSYDEAEFEKWKNGQTKYNFVNANMNEIAHTGFMSNRGRQNVNSFLAKELKHDWRKGAAYFESLLIDYDVHSNWGNWMYNSGVGNDPRDRKFNIQSQADRYDPDNNYQDLWLKN